MSRYSAAFSTEATTYVYFEVDDGENPGQVLDQLLEEGKLRVPVPPSDASFDYSTMTLEGWAEE